MSSDLAAAELIRLMTSKKVDDRVKLNAAKDLLDRANLAGKQSIEVGVVQPKTFEDWVGDALIDADADSNIIDAEVVEDETERTESELERWEREEAQSERQREHQRLTRGSRPAAPRNPERDRAEAKAIRAKRDEPEDDGMSAPDKFGVRQDTRKRKVSPSVSTADPHADRYETPRSRRSVSPKRYEQRQNDRD